MKFKVERAREIFHNRIYRLMEKNLRLPNGRRTTFHIIEHPGAVAVLPVFENGDVMLLRQFRPSIGREIYEIPAGTIEKGEKPSQTARREIVEETGYRARRWTKLGTFYTAPGFCNEKMHVYLAEDLVPAYSAHDADEIIQPLRTPMRKVLQWIRTGRIQDAKTIAGLMIYHDRRG